MQLYFGKRQFFLCLHRTKRMDAKDGRFVFLDVRDQRGRKPMRKFHPKEGRGYFQK